MITDVLGILEELPSALLGLPPAPRLLLLAPVFPVVPPPWPGEVPGGVVVIVLPPKSPERSSKLGISPEVPGGASGGVPGSAPGLPGSGAGGSSETVTVEPLPRLVPGGPITTPGSNGSG